MADAPRRFGRPEKPAPARPPQISCRATNPLSIEDNLEGVFLDETQAKATTATRLFRNNELFGATRVVVREFGKTGRGGGRFCLWSTGCSSGEEVYSIAMVALSEFGKWPRPPSLEAYGTDINPHRIAEARAGQYGRPTKDAFGPEYWRLLGTYARMDNNGVQMGEALRGICRFMLFDMRKRPKKHTFHYIVCNHVLQYYDTQGQRLIIGNLLSVLRPGGLLYLEGVTSNGLDGLPLEKYPGVSNLYNVHSDAGSRISSLLSKKRRPESI